MKNRVIYNFSTGKNHWLIENRHISFEKIIAALDSKGAVDIIKHPNRENYPDQKLIVVELNDYIYLVSFVEEKDGSLFLKTAFPNRKATKEYLGGKL